MEREKIAEVIRSGKAVLGMEFGSTRDQSSSGRSGGQSNRIWQSRLGEPP